MSEREEIFRENSIQILLTFAFSDDLYSEKSLKQWDISRMDVLKQLGKRQLKVGILYAKGIEQVFAVSAINLESLNSPSHSVGI